MPDYISPSAIVNGTLYTLFIFCAITWSIVVYKCWQFLENKSLNKRFGLAFWDAASLAAAEKVTAGYSKSPQARIAQQGFTWLADSQKASAEHLKFQGVPEELLEHELVVQLQTEQHSLEAGLTMLASIGSTAPFVGLFGTVLGIMNAMHEITRSGSTSLTIVAGPIGDALVATAIGIAVAVPAVLAYNLFLRSVKQQRADMENFVASFLRIAFKGKGA